MAVVTVAARGGVLPSLGQGQTVDAGAVTLGLSFVARLAVGRLGRDIVVRMLRGDIGVAARAEVGLVNRGREFGHINEQRDLFAGGIGLGQRLVPVTVQAGAVLNWFGGISLNAHIALVLRLTAKTTPHCLAFASHFLAYPPCVRRVTMA